jgi:hypothetical protein
MGETETNTFATTPNPSQSYERPRYQPSIKMSRSSFNATVESVDGWIRMLSGYPGCPVTWGQPVYDLLVWSKLMQTVIQILNFLRRKLVAKGASEI